MKQQKPPHKSDPLPPHLALTPKRKAKIAELQERLRAEAIARGRLSPEARRMQLGMAHERSARADVDMLSEELRDNRKDKAKIARLNHARGRLAEALAMQGRYDEAAEIEPDGAKSAHYLALWEAVWRDDEETCRCEPFVDGEMSLTHDHIAEEVISQNHDHKLMPVVRCNACGFHNVRPLTHELRQRERAQHQAQAVTHGYDGKHLKHNAAQILTSASLHDAKLLRK